jgi:perosamine synthetase
MTATSPRKLAMHGGAPAFNGATPRWPCDDVDLAAQFCDGSWAHYQGRHNDQLISALQQYLNVPHVYPCCSGTFAVELALRMLKIGSGDEVILAGYDFAGNFRAVEAVGATPVLVDIVPRRWHLDPQQLAAAASPRVKAVVVSHLHGVLAPMRPLLEAARHFGWVVVEDACQATGARVDGQSAGTWGNVGTFSFGGSKLLTAGRGGAVVTHDAATLQRAKVFCERGNHAFPLSELQAGVLLPQIARLEERNEHRRRAVIRIRERFTVNEQAQGPHLLPAELPEVGQHPAYYKLGWLVNVPDDSPNFTRTEQLRDRLALALQAEGIAIDAGFRGFGRRSDARCRKVGDLRHARQAAAGTLVLHHPLLLAHDDTPERLAATLREVAQAVLNEATA